MLTSDGITKDQFEPLWREAMAATLNPAERTRLTLEMGRSIAKEEGQAGPLLVAMSPVNDFIPVLIPLVEVPDPVKAPEVREAVSTRLSEFGAVEVYILATQAGPAGGRVLVSWCEALDGVQHCQMLAFRLRDGKVEEAMPLTVPQPEMTAISRCCSGLLGPHH